MSLPWHSEGCCIASHFPRYSNIVSSCPQLLRRLNFIPWQVSHARLALCRLNEGCPGSCDEGAAEDVPGAMLMAEFGGVSLAVGGFGFGASVAML